jgi:hypothetical protein
MMKTILPTFLLMGATPEASYELAISHPVVAGRLYLRGADGIYCWDLRKGSQ